MTAPKPQSRARSSTLLRYLRLFRRDILSAQPDHLFDAKMAEFRTPFFRSFLVNQPDLVRRVLVGEASDFPKSDRVAEGLRPLLGNSIFVTNGEDWARQRRIIDPAFAESRIAAVFAPLDNAAQAAVGSLEPGTIDVEPWASRAAADGIFRVMFSVPIEDEFAGRVYEAFRKYQRTQPLVNLGAFLPLPRFIPRFVPRKAKLAARSIRSAVSNV